MGYVQTDRNLDLFFEIDYSMFNIPIPAPPPPPPVPPKPKDFDSIPMEVRKKNGNLITSATNYYASFRLV
jgi:hypothetical protein